MIFKAATLRKKYPLFVYERYNYKITDAGLELIFNFKVNPDINFTPKVLIQGVNKKHISQTNKDCLENIIFHIGLMEIPSYWKATCSPHIKIEAGYLTKKQINWWKKVIIKGLGQFFFENKINFTTHNFLKIEVVKDRHKVNFSCDNSLIKQNNFLIPLGGGKDSIVALEMLKKKNKLLNVFALNPTNAAKEVMKISGIKHPIIAKREIDPFLIKLNQRGYLNGHTPFTALLSFLSLLSAFLFGYKNIAFANEKSADEGNLKYRNLIINHQWSKSSEFERMFKKYCKEFLVRNLNYFSLLRRYTELEISKMFSRYPKYFSVFSSCNVAQKRGERWCGECPKCLFVYATLYPFLDKKSIATIFEGKDMFENSKIIFIMKSLIGKGRYKPFECVGTKKESILAFSLSLKKAKKEGKIPSLLYKFSQIHK